MSKKSKRNRTKSPSIPNRQLVPNEKQPQVGAKLRSTIETHIESYSGPLPNPSLLREFDSVVPGCAERIIRMAEQQQQHRHLLERTVVMGDTARANKGLWVGGSIAFIFLAGAVFLIHDGHDWAGAILGSIDLATLVGVFIYGTVTRRTERTQKAQLMHPANKHPNR